MCVTGLGCVEWCLSSPCYLVRVVVVAGVDDCQAKHDLYDICFEQAMKHASKVAGDDFGYV